MLHFPFNHECIFLKLQFAWKSEKFGVKEKIAFVLKFLNWQFSQVPEYLQLLWIHMNSSKYIRIHPNTSEYIRIHPNTSEYILIIRIIWIIRIHPNTSKYIRIHPNTFTVKRMNQLYIYHLKRMWTDSIWNSAHK